MQPRLENDRFCAISRHDQTVARSALLSIANSGQMVLKLRKKRRWLSLILVNGFSALTGGCWIINKLPLGETS
jgi:hypothetical protein